MATLAADVKRDYALTGSETRTELPVVASDIIYEGAAVGDNGSGLMRPLVAADVFTGFAMRRCDNSAGAASAKNVAVRSSGHVYLSVTSVVDADDVGEVVYASDDATFTLSSTGNSAIGKIVRWVSGTNCVVYFEAGFIRSI